jgi:hypothetical protein
VYGLLPDQVDGFFPRDLVDGSQIVGAILGLIALVVALVAIVKSNRDLPSERRIEHQLAALRDLGNLLERFDQGSFRRSESQP